MNASEKHRALVRRLKKPPATIRANLGLADTDLIHAALGIAGEGGEVVDLIKKRVINGHDAAEFRAKLAEELGDLLFYIQVAATYTGCNLDEIMARNVSKLEARYPDGYSDQASQERLDESA